MPRMTGMTLFSIESVDCFFRYSATFGEVFGGALSLGGGLVGGKRSMADSEVEIPEGLLRNRDQSCCCLSAAVASPGVANGTLLEGA